MTIECYFGECSFHGVHSGEEGPFCFESTCRYMEYARPRIKKLEAAMPLYDELLIRCAIAEKDLAALRQRIADAPVVAWHYVINGTLDCYDRQCPPDDAYDEGSLVSLISKEDLQK